jgi:hypothetical protein
MPRFITAAEEDDADLVRLIALPADAEEDDGALLVSEIARRIDAAEVEVATIEML